MRSSALLFIVATAAISVLGCSSPTAAAKPNGGSAGIDGSRMASNRRATGVNGTGTRERVLEIAGSGGALEAAGTDGTSVAVDPRPASDARRAISLPACKEPTGVYFSDVQNGTVSRIDLATRKVTTVVTAMADDLALDSKRGQLYFPAEDKRIFRISTDGTGLVPVLDDVEGAYCLALDLIDNRIFWTNQTKRPQIQRASISGKKVADLLQDADCCTIGIALDIADHRMYWMEGYYRGRVMRADLDGTYVQIIARTVGIANGIDVDAAGGKVYWTEYGNGPNDDVVRRANLDGSRVETLLTGAQGLSTPQHIAVDRAGGHFYLADLHAGRVLRAKLDGSNVETLWQGSAYPRAIALDRPEPCR